MDERGSDARIDAARQPQNHFLVTHLGADALHGVIDVIAHHPVGPGAADVEDEALEYRAPLSGVRHLGVELDAVEAARLVGHAGDRAARRRGHQGEAGRQRRDLVAMAHPDAQHAVAGVGVRVLDAGEEPGVPVGADLRVAELPVGAGLDLAALLHRHREHPVADAEDGHAQVPHRPRRPQIFDLVGAGVAAGEDHALHGVLTGIGPDPLVADVVRVDFAVDVRLAHAAGDQLGDLRAEIENEDGVMGHESKATRDSGDALRR